MSYGLHHLNVPKGKINCYCVVSTVSLRVPAKLTRELSTFTATSRVSQVLQKGLPMLLILHVAYLPL
jgi:hypothetical protein